MRRFVLSAVILICTASLAHGQKFTSTMSAYLEVRPGSKQVALVGQQKLLTSSDEWEVNELKPYLFHLRRTDWKDFFWQVNTSRKLVEAITNAEFGSLGGDHLVLRGVSVESVDNATPERAPDRFTIRFNAITIFHDSGGEGTTAVLLTNTGDRRRTILDSTEQWESKALKSYLFQIRRRNWESSLWKVNTSRTQVYNIEGGSLDSLGGTQTATLRATVRAVR